jgi:hypothetical protein
MIAELDAEHGGRAYALVTAGGSLGDFRTAEHSEQ